ncbi:LysM peptidoglycan-binding domain-containing protein [Pseudonocardia spinosispora]|uniref:LysM peptidoglycan-binding domain-containing protein n=1 Tax=Pseudonocardia spinosispora TaxID=103441 RepID=UPI000426B512|nr:LysM peptidoglycan-binding domain-containing protein [Pseudonocardia spinosispora]
MGAIDSVAVGRSEREGVRRAPARKVAVAPVPTGPGRTAHPPRRTPSARIVVPSCSSTTRRAAVRSGARPVPVRPVRRPAPRVVLDSRIRLRRAVASVVLLAVGMAVVVAALGLLSDAVASARVPDTTGVVQVHGAESLWQVARRVAPSADPAAVAARIVELNHLNSPSVQAGQRLVSPIG